ncbi:MAG: C25 family cysteine peptidase, partial [Candidatus Thermoplasmatota archaeon]
LRNEILHAKDFDIKIDYVLPEKIESLATYDFLIISPDAWLNELEALKQHKESKGIKTIVVGLNEIYSGKYFSSYGRDDAEKIKYFIKNAIEEWGIKYVLFVGDVDIFPVRYTSLAIDDPKEAPCDLYFADIYYPNGSFSSWDNDRDKKYGERIDDKPDLMPDVHLSRLPVSDENELNIAIEKIINYTTPPMKAIAVGVELFWDTIEREGEYLKEEINKNINFKVIRLYETDDYEKDGNANAFNIAKFINEGALLVNFASHGNPYGMGWESGGFWIDDLSMLKNKYFPVVFAMACSTNEFDTTDCFGEKFVLSNHGAIAYAGSSRVAYVYLGNAIKSGLAGYLDRAFFRAYYDGCKSIGEIFSRAKIDYLNTIPFKSEYDYLTIYEYNLLGDPTIQIPEMPLTSRVYVSNEKANGSIKIWVEVEENSTVDLYYRKKIGFGGKWKIYCTMEKDYEIDFLPEEEGYYEFYSILRKENYTENKPAIADAHCLFDFSPPSINVIKPMEGKIYIFGKEILEINAKFAIVIGRMKIEASADATKIELYIDNELKSISYENKFSWIWKEFSLGWHELKFIAYDEVGNKAEKKIKVFSLII